MQAYLIFPIISFMLIGLIYKIFNPAKNPVKQKLFWILWVVITPPALFGFLALIDLMFMPR